MAKKSYYSKDDRKSLVKAFKAAKKTLRMYRFHGICNALYLAYESGEISFYSKSLAQSCIMSALGEGYVDSWLERIHNIRLDNRRLQIYRQAWLDHLIKMYS